jgi:dihydrolipoamide dehydrogenase
VIVLGGGHRRLLDGAARRQLGLEVALIERAKVGGTCLHWGCIPTKAILHSAEVAEPPRTPATSASPSTTTASRSRRSTSTRTRRRQDVEGLQGTLKSRGVETVIGTGRLTDATPSRSRPRTAPARSAPRRSSSPPGSAPRELPFAPFDGERIISSDHALHLEELPSSAIILGSGAIGMEFATAWDAFGVEVTVVELLDRLLPLEDADASKEIARAFRKRGITTMTSTKATGVETTDDGVRCTVETSKGDEETLEADLLLVAVGRGPVTEGAGLDAAGVEVDDRGFVTVDEYCRTNVAGIWALGDVIPTLGLAHASFAGGHPRRRPARRPGRPADRLQGRAAGDLLAPGGRLRRLHRGGGQGRRLRRRGREVPVPGRSAGRDGQGTGMVKLIAEKDEDAEGGAGRILGIHIVGPRATDLIAEGQLIYGWEALASDVAHLIHAHPSFSEALGEAHLAIAGRALHG